MPGDSSANRGSRDPSHRGEKENGPVAGRSGGAIGRYGPRAAGLLDVEKTISPQKTSSAPAGGRDDIVRLVVACDHRGYEGKLRLLPKLAGLSCEVIDIGCDGERGCDYPDYAAPAARMVAEGEADAAVLLDGSGIGMAIVANKIRGVRAATCHDELTARIAREHNHCNVLCVGTDLVGERALANVVEIFLTTPFSGGRHVRRVAKIDAVEIEEGTELPARLRASS